MKILSIETSCDETAVAILSFKEESDEKISYVIESDELYSQIDLHQEYGGVYPTIAKREHQRILPQLIHNVLKDKNYLKNIDENVFTSEIKDLTKKHIGLSDDLEKYFEKTNVDDIDAIAVTFGPGLAPALWVGVTIAQTLSSIWNIPLIPVNHMEGHIFAAYAKDGILFKPSYPTLSLLVSGGHTELVLTTVENNHKRIGQTLDDASGESFDKVARLLNLPYPGGPEISKLAKEAREKNITSEVVLPRPMLKDDSYNFSYSGLKTAVRTYVEKHPSLNEKQVLGLAREFEESVVETLVTKTLRSVEEYNPKTLIVGGGVSANSFLRETLTEKIKNYPSVNLFIPDHNLSTDNAVMIALAGYIHKDNPISVKDIIAEPKLTFGN